MHGRSGGAHAARSHCQHWARRTRNMAEHGTEPHRLLVAQVLDQDGQRLQHLRHAPPQRRSTAGPVRGGSCRGCAGHARTKSAVGHRAAESKRSTAPTCIATLPRRLLRCCRIWLKWPAAQGGRAAHGQRAVPWLAPSSDEAGWRRLWSAGCAPAAHRPSRFSVRKYSTMPESCWSPLRRGGASEGSNAARRQQRRRQAARLGGGTWHAEQQGGRAALQGARSALAAPCIAAALVRAAGGAPSKAAHAGRQARHPPDDQLCDGAQRLHHGVAVGVRHDRVLQQRAVQVLRRRGGTGRGGGAWPSAAGTGTGT